jgi:HD-like signal output (HDOD) protein
MACSGPALKALDRLPPSSPILNRLLATMAGDDVSFAELADLIEKDTVLAGNVLRLVNSPLYGFRATVSSVRHGVAILGINKLRNVALGLSVTRICTAARTPQGWSSSRFNLHSVATAVLVDLLAQQAAAPYPEGGFVAGLMHDLGKLLIAIALPSEYGAVRRLADSGAGLIDAERDVLGMTHAELSGLALERWNLPEPIRNAVRFHHDPDAAANGALHLSHVVRAADELANGLGHESAHESRQPDAAGKSLEVLAVSDGLPRVLEQFKSEFEALRSFF